MTTDELTTLRIDNALKAAYSESPYLHEADARAEQALTNLVEDLDFQFGSAEEDDKINAVAGALCAMALIGWQTAWEIASDFYTGGLDYDEELPEAGE